MKSSISIFLIHRGNGDILKYALNQVKFTNPDSKVGFAW